MWVRPGVVQGWGRVAGGTVRGVYRATTSDRADSVRAELMSYLQNAHTGCRMWVLPAC
jgi:hypothetical protein